MHRPPPPLYWTVLEPHWRSVSINDGAETFLAQYGALPAGVGVLFAAHWCQSEVRNGGFHQFFSNPTGVLAPEAATAFRSLRLLPWAETLLEAMRSFGAPYPRDRGARCARLSGDRGPSRADWDPFVALDRAFFALLASDRHAFTAAADTFASALLQRSS
ncbi:MAG: DUF4375 domain-containing protein [Nitrosomonas sp.]|nr:DUF4375 domain-containing protein [Nitrosomonas sp.]MCW5607931.1 DUF4375 domain-containing protein [Nitrosomonas sp.]